MHGSKCNRSRNVRLYTQLFLLYISPMRRPSPPAIPFSDPALGARNLRILSEAFVSSGTSQSLQKFMSTIEGRLRHAPDPDRVVAHLLRFVESSFGAARVFTDLTVYPAVLDLLLGIFGHSQFFAELLIRDPELFDWLREGETLTEPVDPHAITDEVQSAFRLFAKEERRLSAVRRIHRRELLRISAQDILGNADLASVTRQLSDLADAVSAAVLELCFLQLANRFPGRPPVPFTIIGLGKHGGQELNYSSDIDVMFVYGEEGILKDRSERETTFLEYFNLLAGLFIRTMSQSTAEGTLYRVDARLRPEGKAGPLARSVRGYLGYYEARGDLWERQMLLKARPMAGDTKFGDTFLGMLDPFVFPRTFLQHPADAIVRMKTRIEQKVGDRANIKLRAGGIRDIEFIIQGLQLINGGQRKHLRERNSLKALRLLAEGGLLPESDAAVLSGAYQFLRTLEHRLQIMQNQQTHTLPDDPVKLRSLALRMGLKHEQALLKKLDRLHTEVREIFDRVMSAGDEGETAGITGVMDGILGEAATESVLRHYGIVDVHSALRSIRSIAGNDLAGQRRLDVRARAALRDSAGSLFGAIAKTPDPDLTLKNLAHLLASHPSPSSIIHALGDRPLRKLVLDIASGSTWVTRRLAADPLAFEQVIGDPVALHAPSAGDLGGAGDIHRAKHRAELRSALRYLLGFSALEELTSELSALADGVIRCVLARVEREIGGGSGLAVFAMGKLGSRELTIDADLDLVFFSGRRDSSKGGIAERVAEQLLRDLGTVSEQGFLYSVDVRLRPEGRNGPLTIGIDGYQAYLGNRASFWERQSMTRMRHIAGDGEVGKEISSRVEDYVYRALLPRNWIDQIAAMRKKMEAKTQSTLHGALDIKRGAGGMIDVEFIVQMIQMRHGGRLPLLRMRPVYDILRDEQCPVLTLQEKRLLADHYAFFRRTEAMIRLALEGRSAVLPSGPALQTLARCAAHMEKDEFRREVAARMKEVRGTYGEICDRLARDNV